MFSPQEPQVLPAAAFHPRSSCISEAAPARPLAALHSIEGEEQGDLTLSLMFKGALKSQRISEHEMQPLIAGEKDRG